VRVWVWGRGAESTHGAPVRSGGGARRREGWAARRRARTAGRRRARRRCSTRGAREEKGRRKPCGGGGGVRAPSAFLGTTMSVIRPATSSSAAPTPTPIVHARFRPLSCMLAAPRGGAGGGGRRRGGGAAWGGVGGGAAARRDAARQTAGANGGAAAGQAPGARRPLAAARPGPRAAAARRRARRGAGPGGLSRQPCGACWCCAPTVAPRRLPHLPRRRGAIKCSATCSHPCPRRRGPAGRDARTPRQWARQLPTDCRQPAGDKGSGEHGEFVMAPGLPTARPDGAANGYADQDAGDAPSPTARCGPLRRAARPQVDQDRPTAAAGRPRRRSARGRRGAHAPPRLGVGGGAQHGRSSHGAGAAGRGSRAQEFGRRTRPMFIRGLRRTHTSQSASPALRHMDRGQPLVAAHGGRRT
jgi:hypothetical protein